MGDKKHTLKKILRFASKPLAVFVVLVLVFSPLVTYEAGATSHTSAVPESFVGLSDAPTGQNSTPGGHQTAAASVQTLGKIPTPENTIGNVGCSWSPSDWELCLTGVVYAFTVGIGSGFAYVAAGFLDRSTALSLNSDAYALQFIADGWTVVRAIANMFFINHY